MGAAHCRSRTRASRSHPVTFTQSLAGIGAPLKQAKIVSCSFSLTVWRRRNLACFAKNEEVPKIDLWNRLRVLPDHVHRSHTPDAFLEVPVSTRYRWRCIRSFFPPAPT